MVDYFVDSTTGSNADSGLTMDLAWATVEYALESGGLAAGDNVWVRRLHSEIPLTDISPIYDGSSGNPIQIIGWPRATIPNTTITEADWTNGNALIDNVVGITPNREKYINRYCTAPDGKIYYITAVVYEAGIDGMAAGAEFAVGETLTNTTQTKKGKVWGFTDNLDTTGTLQYVRDSSNAWINNDNITSDGGGDAEIDVGGEVAVGFLIDREYPGATVTGTSGLFQIEADDDYDLAQAIDDTGWTITVANWTADADDVPLIDFNSTAFQLIYSSDDYHIIKNIEIKNSSHSNGGVFANAARTFTMIGCLVSTTSNTKLCTFQVGYTYLERVIFEGTGYGTSQEGIRGQRSQIIIKDCAVYNCGSYGIVLIEGADMFVENLNIGIEQINSNDDIYNSHGHFLSGKDIKLNGTNGYVLFGSRAGKKSKVQIENYQKNLGDHKTWFVGGEYTNVNVGDTNAPSITSTSGNISDLIEILPNISGFEFIENWAFEIFVHEFEATIDSKTYTYYLQNNLGVTINASAKDDIWLKAEYVDSYDDNSEYHNTEVFSAETSIAQRADDTDWDSLSVTVQPAVASKVRITLYISKYVASGGIYLDPLVGIS